MGGSGRRNVPHEYAVALDRVGDRLGILGTNVHWFEAVSSTSDVATDLFERGPFDGLVVVADAQSGGRGTRGRRWSSPAGAGVYASVVLASSAAGSPLVPLAGGVAIADGIQAAAGLNPQLKWPNDVLWHGAKVAGVLAERGRTADSRARVVLGFGINIRAAQHPPDVARRATTLEDELGRPIDRGTVLAECLCALSRRWEQLTSGNGEDVLRDWRARAEFGQTVEWHEGSIRRIGVAEAIDTEGALLVRTGDGMRRVIGSQVRWLV